MEVKSYQVTVNLKKIRTAPQIVHKSIFGNSSTRQKLLLEHGNHCSILTPSERLWYEQHLVLPAGETRCKVQPPSLLAQRSAGEHQVEEESECISLWKYQPWQSSTQGTYALFPGPRCHQLVSLTNKVDARMLDSGLAPSLPDAAALSPFQESSAKEPKTIAEKPAKSKKKHEAGKGKTSKSIKPGDEKCQSHKKARQKSILEHFAEMRSSAADIQVIYDSHSQESRGDGSLVRTNAFERAVSPTSDASLDTEMDCVSSSAECKLGLWSDESLLSPSPFDDSIERETLLTDSLVCLRRKNHDDVRRSEELGAYVQKENDVRWIDDLVFGNASKGENFNTDVNSVVTLKDLDQSAFSHLEKRNDVSIKSNATEKVEVQLSSSCLNGTSPVPEKSIPEYVFAPKIAFSTPIVKPVVHSKEHSSSSPRPCDTVKEAPEIAMKCPFSSIKKSSHFNANEDRLVVQDSTSPIIATAKSRKPFKQKTSAKRLFCNGLSTISSGDEESAAEKYGSNSLVSGTDCGNKSLEPGKPRPLCPLPGEEVSSNFEYKMKKLNRFSAPALGEKISSAEIRIDSNIKSECGRENEGVDLKTFRKNNAPNRMAESDTNSHNLGPITSKKTAKNDDLFLPSNFVKNSSVILASNASTSDINDMQNPDQKRLAWSPKSVAETSNPTPRNISKHSECNTQFAKKANPHLPSTCKRQGSQKKSFVLKFVASKITFDLGVDDLLGSCSSDLPVLNSKPETHTGTKTNGVLASCLTANTILTEKYPDFFEDNFDASCDLSLYTTVCKKDEGIKLKDSQASKDVKSSPDRSLDHRCEDDLVKSRVTKIRTSSFTKNLNHICEDESTNLSVKKITANEAGIASHDQSDLLSLTQAVALINKSGNDLSKRQFSPFGRSRNEHKDDFHPLGSCTEATFANQGLGHSEVDKIDDVKHVSQPGEDASALKVVSSPLVEKLTSLRKESAEEAKKAIEDLASLINAEEEDLFKNSSSCFWNRSNLNMNKSMDLFAEDGDISQREGEEIRFAPEAVLSSQQRRKSRKLSRKGKNKSAERARVDLEELPEWGSQDCDLPAATSSDLSSLSCGNQSLSLLADDLLDKKDVSNNCSDLFGKKDSNDCLGMFGKKGVSDNLSIRSGPSDDLPNTEMNDIVGFLNAGALHSSNTAKSTEFNGKKSLKTNDLNRGVVDSVTGSPLEKASVCFKSSNNSSLVAVNLKGKGSSTIHKNLSHPSANVKRGLGEINNFGATDPATSSVPTTASVEIGSDVSDIHSSCRTPILVKPQVQNEGTSHSGYLKTKRRLSLKDKSSIAADRPFSSFEHSETPITKKLHNNKNVQSSWKRECSEGKKVKFDLTINTENEKGIAPPITVGLTPKSLALPKNYVQNLADESASTSDVSIVQARSKNPAHLIDSDTSDGNESLNTSSGNDQVREKLFPPKSRGKSTVHASIRCDRSPQKPLDASAGSCSSEDFDFRARAPRVNVPEIAAVVRKKSSNPGARCHFVDTEADVSHDSRVVVSSDEEEGGHHDDPSKYDESFVDDRHQPTQADGVDMRGVYLRSVRSPAVKSKLRPQNWLAKADVCSQPYECDEDESYAESGDDSFVVGNDCVEYDSQFTIGNDAHDSLMVPRGKASSSCGKKRKRIVVADSSSDEDG